MREVLILVFVAVLVVAGAYFADRTLELGAGTSINFIAPFALLCGGIFAYRRWKRRAQYKAIIDNPGTESDVVGPETKTYRGSGSDIDLGFDD